MNANAPVSRGETFPIGLTRDSEEFRTSSHRIAQFAKSVDDENPHHLAGKFAPPVFSHVPVMQSMVEILEQVTGGFALHGEHDFIFHTPIVPAQRLFTVSTLVGIGATKPGTTFIVRSDTRTHDGKPVITQYSTCLVRGGAPAQSHGEAVPARPTSARGAAAVVSRYALTPDQTRRYADAARDYSAYTIDPAAAAKVGYAAPLVHGMLTLSLAARAIVDDHCGGETPRLKRLGCRFAAPLLLTPGQTLKVEHWNGPGGPIGFEASDKDGNIVIKNGYAEVSK
ncbi:MaoC/PaaZ C-terminal domain-containing protein [Mesorhizobium sp. IMUNJ 23232]|uniref:MaoC/PaaZ C-terminal domain-containing protein n=1 Tax=Mesorhizobium sp. IMUNJ 23232 TaxID=3376064 RepID=UPI0037982AF0